MTPEEALKWIEESPNPQERAWRKHLTFGIRYASGMSKERLAAVIREIRNPKFAGALVK